MVAETTAYRTQNAKMGCYQSGPTYRKEPRNSAISRCFWAFNYIYACIKDCVLIDPAMGSAGFLIAAQEYLRKNEPKMFFDAKAQEHFHNHMFYGFDMDRTMLRIGAMNMLLHGVDNPNIEYRDSLSEQNKDYEKYTLVLANEAVICGLTPEKACNFKEFAA